MAFNDSVGLFGRDKSRNVSSEHTGVLYGAALASAIEQEEFRTEANDNITTFNFNDENKAVGTDACTTLNVKFSKSTATRSWTYDADNEVYTSSDYKNDVTRTNLIVLYDTTEYVVKEDYKGSGKSETYCNYELAGGSGKLASLGTITDITWSVENGALVLKDSDGNEINLNTGKTWIGWSSSNNGGTNDFS
jgi:hypothetical protein